MNRKLLLVVGICGGVMLAGAVGCKERKVVVVREPVPLQQPAEVILVPEAPPPAVVERRPPPPGPGYVWVSGYWTHQHGRYVWAPGRWERPPHRNGVWVAPRWERTPRGWRHTPGHWR